MSSVDKIKFDQLRIDQRLRVQTNVAGSYHWVFPFAYGNGIKPVASADVEDPDANAIVAAKIVSLTNATMGIQVYKTTVVTVVAINVLAFSSTPQSFIHLRVTDPN